MNGKSKWQVPKRAQAISYTSPKEASITDKALKFNYLATSKLPVSTKNLSPATCTLGIKVLIPTETPGICTIVLSQMGNSQFLPAKSVEFHITIFGTNIINFQLPESILMSQGSYSLVATSSSGLPVTFTSSTQDVCAISNSTLTLLNAGICKVAADQTGGDFIPAAVPTIQSMQVKIVSSTINFILPTALLLSQGPYSLAATSTSNVPVTFSSLTLDVCTVTGAALTLLKAGTCQVSASQAGSSIYSAASITRSVEISAVRVLSDLPDQVSGFQLKAIYVLPSDGADNSYDTNGRIASFLTEGNDFLKSELGLTLPIDTTTTGFDITFLKSSKPMSYFLSSSDSDYELLQETKFLEIPSSNRKDFLFFIDVPYVEGANICGFARARAIAAVIAIGSGTCTQKSGTVNSFASTTWIHELFHTFGVSHVPDPCDLMASNNLGDGPLCAADVRETIDRGKKFYVGSSSYGQNILQLRVWSGYTADQGLKADCWDGSGLPRSDGFLYASCPTGTRTIGTLGTCWSNISSISLEEFTGGVWRSLGSGNSYAELFGGDLYGRHCNNSGYTAPWKEITVDSPGIRHYRWIVNGAVGEEMNIIWVK